MKIRVLQSTKNSKLGSGISASYGTKEHCHSCPLHLGGCYAESGHLAVLARKLKTAKEGLGNIIGLSDYSQWLKLQPTKRLLDDAVVDSCHRFFIDGNPPLSSDGTIDTTIAKKLFESNNGRSIFYISALFSRDKDQYLKGIKNNYGISAVVNYSSHSIRESLGIVRQGGNATLTARTDGSPLTVIGGVRFVTCPAAVEGSSVTCSSCGNGSPLCSRNRDFIIVFPPHGAKKGSIKPSLSTFKTSLNFLSLLDSKSSMGQFYSIEYAKVSEKGIEILTLACKVYGLNKQGNLLVRIYSGKRFGQFRTLRPDSINFIRQNGSVIYSNIENGGIE